MTNILGNKKLKYFLVIAITGFACNTPVDETSQSPFFELLSNKHTGLEFINTQDPTSSFNVFNYLYFYNGGGIAAGDFNGDGLIDLFFTSNMGENALFINRGNMQFEDITTPSGLGGYSGGWTTGVSVVDINQDGLLDLYVLRIGDYQSIKGRNQLFVCRGVEDGIPIFEEKAAEYGLDIEAFGTQALFFDYDLDNDLDVFILNHSLHADGTFGKRKEFTDRSELSGDRLLENRNGRYVDVTNEAGIYSTAIGYGLGVVAGDVNMDGWPDLYVGNDFHENDYLYINNGDGTFTEVLTSQIGHTSRFTMGVDMADLNNDAFAEIISLDMLPEDPFVLKSSLTEDPPNIYQFKLGYGYHYQYARNALQLNNGDGTFSEIATFAGVQATDWSWAPLLFDFDMDGYKDLFVSNGILRRMNDIDYINYRANNEIQYKQQTNDLEEEDLVVVEKMPKIAVRNKFYRNNGNLGFQDISSTIQGDKPGFSHGAIYADLDNDGDLDVVTNNQEDGPYVYRNLSVDNGRAGRYLAIRPAGPPRNRNAIGARLVAYSGSDRLYFEHFPVRGFQSSSAGPFHAALGHDDIDSIHFIWPDRSYQSLDPTWADTTVTVQWEAGLPVFDFSAFSLREKRQPLVAATPPKGLRLDHEEDAFLEFNRERLIPHAVSATGPALAVADVNGDGLDDVFLGAAKNRPSRLFLQNDSGHFALSQRELFASDSLFEDVSAVFADLNGNGAPDLVVASGGNEFAGDHASRVQRVYWNDGTGRFSVDKGVFGPVHMTASCVVAGDFNADGLPDLFFGGRSVPGTYGEIPDSYLFINAGEGRFEDRTEQLAPGLRNVGMVTAARAADLDGNGRDDLVLAIEWGPVTAFLQGADGLERTDLGPQKGWWQTIHLLDADGDGDLDVLAGNIGENTKLKPSEDYPVRMYLNDFDENGQLDQIVTHYIGEKEYPFATYNELTAQIPDLRKKFIYATDFAAATADQLFEKTKWNEAEVLEINELSSVYFEQVSPGVFEAAKLPWRLQLSSTNAFLGVDGGKSGVVAGGNFYGASIEQGRYDASYGHWMEWSEESGWVVYPLNGIRLDGQIRHLVPITVKGAKRILVVRNDGPGEVLRVGE
jgi:enediyne biosynthesis protein E4